MTNPTLIQRPAGVTPEAWARASWYARLRHVNAISREQRAPVEPDPAQRPVAEVIAERVAAILAERPATLDEIAAELDRKPATVLRRLISGGRRDLAEHLSGATE